MALCAELVQPRSKLAAIEAWRLGSCPRFTQLDVNALVGAAVGLGAARFGGDLSDAELELVSRLISLPSTTIDHLRDLILDGADPLGDVLRNVGLLSTRKLSGVSYTPQHVVDRMMSWGKQAGTPTRVVDPGTGSGRFLLSAFRAFGTGVPLVGVDLDPLATLVARGNLAAAGALNKDVRIRHEDFCRSSLRRQPGTLWVGNPPYVRHQAISRELKDWLGSLSPKLGYVPSALMGLHGYFLLKIATLTAEHDRGALLTSAEWLDVQYGESIQRAFLDILGGVGVNILNQNKLLFGNKSTAAVVFFKSGAQSPISFRRINSAKKIADTDGPAIVLPREEVSAGKKWTFYATQSNGRAKHRGLVPLREIADVHRGIATGGNKFFVRDLDDPLVAQMPEQFSVPCIAHASELYACGEVFAETDIARRLIVLPPDLLSIPGDIRRAVRRFLRSGEKDGTAARYLCKDRKYWYVVPLRPSAPTILATYMSARPPKFVSNPDGVWALNVVHGIYPRVPLEEPVLRALVRFLNTAGDRYRAYGRQYGGGMTKFEPTEMASLPVPPLDGLSALALLLEDDDAFQDAALSIARKAR